VPGSSTIWRVVKRRTVCPAAVSAASFARSRSEAILPVVAPAVGIDHQAVRREVEVDLVRLVVEVGEDGVAHRLGQSGAAAEGPEAAFEPAAGEGGVVGRGLPQRLRAASAVMTVEHVVDRALVRG
jgi:hypothetical protein